METVTCGEPRIQYVRACRGSELLTADCLYFVESTGVLVSSTSDPQENFESSGTPMWCCEGTRAGVVVWGEYLEPCDEPMECWEPEPTR